MLPPRSIDRETTVTRLGGLLDGERLVPRLMGGVIGGGVISDAILRVAVAEHMHAATAGIVAAAESWRRFRGVAGRLQVWGRNHRTLTGPFRKKSEHGELEVRMILKARFSMRWPGRNEI